MNIGLPEVTLIVVIILVLFGITWVIRDKKRHSGRPASTDASAGARENKKKA